jgi:formylglycine-generating enzyme
MPRSPLCALCIFIAVFVTPAVLLAQLPAPAINVDLPGDATMTMLWVEPGTFAMGSPPADAAIYQDEGPQHQVRISRGGYLGQFEITQGQWFSVMGTRPWEGQNFVEIGPDFAAVHLSWDDIQAFVAAINADAGTAAYRLPTEAEWEYVCRAGTDSKWSFGDDESQIGEYAWYRDNTWPREVFSHRIGLKKPNPWGFFDMHGNVWEWVADWYGPYAPETQTDPTGAEDGVFKVTRGGIYLSTPTGMRSAARDAGFSDFRDGGVGARIWLESPPPTAVIPRTWGQMKTAD